MDSTKIFTHCDTRKIDENDIFKYYINDMGQVYRIHKKTKRVFLCKLMRKKDRKNNFYCFINNREISVPKLMLKTFKSREVEKYNGNYFVGFYDNDDTNLQLKNLFVIPKIKNNNGGKRVVFVNLKEKKKYIFKNTIKCAVFLGYSKETIRKVLKSQTKLRWENYDYILMFEKDYNKKYKIKKSGENKNEN